MLVRALPVVRGGFAAAGAASPVLRNVHDQWHAHEGGLVMAGGLLQRMAALARGEPEPSLEVLVRDHLQSLLNTRQGSSALDAEYGLPDFTDLVVSFPHGRAQMCANIASCITRNEPRLSNVKVEILEPADDLERKAALLRFVIHATYVQGGGPLQLQSSMTPGGQVTVQ